MEVLSCASVSILENDHEKNNAKFGSHFIRVDGICSWGWLSQRQPSRAMLPRRLKALSLPLKAYRLWCPPLTLRRRLPQRCTSLRQS